MMMFLVLVGLLAGLLAFVPKVRQQGRKLAGITLGSLAVAGAAVADSSTYLDTGTAAHFGQLKSDITTLAGQAWPVVYVLAGIFFAIAIFKKFARKPA